MQLTWIQTNHSLVKTIVTYTTALHTLWHAHPNSKQMIFSIKHCYMYNKVADYMNSKQIIFLEKQCYKYRTLHIKQCAYMNTNKSLLHI